MNLRLLEPLLAIYYSSIVTWWLSSQGQKMIINPLGTYQEVRILYY